MVSFPCVSCGTTVTVAVRRNHRFCAVCSAERRAAGRKLEEAGRHDRTNGMLAASREAGAFIVGLLGVSPVRPGCVGCGAPLTPARRAGGLPKKWCSEGCRVRVARGGASGGYAGALLGDPCAYCGEQGGQFDHIDPSSRGGGNEWDNFAGACASCNTQKGTMSLLRYLLARPLYAQVDRAKSELARLAA